YIAAMSNPWTISGKQVMIATPEYDWEKIGFLVNEGAAVLKRNGKIFITFSASATDYNYCMGLFSPRKTVICWTRHHGAKQRCLYSKPMKLPVNMALGITALR